MPALSTTYLLPAILLNPAFILHLINTFVSHLVPPSPPVISHTPHPFMESIGPVPGSTPYWDMHADDALCWRYTAVMVVVQVLAFGRVQDNRVARRERRAAAKAERERRKHEIDGEDTNGKVVPNGLYADDIQETNGKVAANGVGMDGAQDTLGQRKTDEGLHENWEVNGNGAEDLIVLSSPETLKKRTTKTESKESFIGRLARQTREIQAEVLSRPARKTTDIRAEALEVTASEESSTSEEEMMG